MKDGYISVLAQIHPQLKEEAAAAAFINPDMHNLRNNKKYMEIILI